MGIIKTAMITGGGLYAINRLAKTAERRHSSPSQDPATNSQNERREFPTKSSPRIYPTQQFQPRYETRDMYDDGRKGYPSQEQQNYYLANDNPYAPLPQGYLEYDNAPASRPWEAQQQPPAREYYASAPYARGQQSGFVLNENEDYAQTQSRSLGSRSLLNHPMAQQAMQFAMAQAGGKESKKGKGDGEGGMSQMLSGLLSK